MPPSNALLLGEFRRTVDERYRVSVPSELIDAMIDPGADCILAKERSGSLSLWNADKWQTKLEIGKKLVEDKMSAGRLEGRIEEVQMLGRLLSTRHKEIQLTGRGRLLIPDGFREFLGVEPGGDVLIVGAALCIEIWRPESWVQYIEEQMPEFRKLFDDLSG